MKETINFSDWERLELRVGKIIEVDEIKEADKLFELTIDVGKEIGKRIVCAGIKEHYKKEELMGKNIILFVNLQPRKLKGIESQGMLLAAEDKNGKVILISPEKDIENGSLIK